MPPPKRGTEEKHESDVDPEPKRQVTLSREQRRLHDALAERGEKLGRFIAADFRSSKTPRILIAWPSRLTA